VNFHSFEEGKILKERENFLNIKNGRKHFFQTILKHVIENINRMRDEHLCNVFNDNFKKENFQEPFSS